MAMKAADVMKKKGSSKGKGGKKMSLMDWIGDHRGKKGSKSAKKGQAARMDEDDE